MRELTLYPWSSFVRPVVENKAEKRRRDQQKLRRLRRQRNLAFLLTALAVTAAVLMGILCI